MGRNLLLYLSKDEKLAEAVSKYPCLHDMSCNNYKNQICLGNAMAEVDREWVSRKVKLKLYTCKAIILERQLHKRI